MDYSIGYSTNINLLLEALQTVWQVVVGFFPAFLMALLVFLIGWIVGTAFGTVVEHLTKAFLLDDLVSKLAAEKALERLGLGVRASAVLGRIVKWFFMVAFLLAAVNILGLHEVSDFLLRVLNYLPHVFVAALILMIGAVAADVIERLIRGSAEAAGYRDAAFVGVLIRWSIWVFTLFAVLLQLGIAEELVRVLISGFVAMLALAGGLAFGLGGRDVAAEWLEEFAARLKRRS